MFHLPVAQVVVVVFLFGWLVSFTSPSVFIILDCRGFANRQKLQYPRMD